MTEDMNVLARGDEMGEDSFLKNVVVIWVKI